MFFGRALTHLCVIFFFLLFSVFVFLFSSSAYHKHTHRARSGNGAKFTSNGFRFGSVQFGSARFSSVRFDSASGSVAVATRLRRARNVIEAELTNDRARRVAGAQCMCEWCVFVCLCECLSARAAERFRTDASACVWASTVCIEYVSALRLCVFVIRVCILWECA